jgi:hypothetical protein
VFRIQQTYARRFATRMLIGVVIVGSLSVLMCAGVIVVDKRLSKTPLITTIGTYDDFEIGMTKRAVFDTVVRKARTRRPPYTDLIAYEPHESQSETPSRRLSYTDALRQSDKWRWPSNHGIVVQHVFEFQNEVLVRFTTRRRLLETP